MEHLHSAHGSGRLFPHREIRSGNAADLPPKRRTDTGAYPRLLPGADNVANPTAMDEGIRTWCSPEKTAGGVAGTQIARRASADKGEKPQTQDGGNPGEGTQSTASENEDSSPQQTKNHRKCSDENGLIFIVEKNKCMAKRKQEQFISLA